jgi:catechol 2,3-dioxygenase-like lactoylglutathione lyase family enzyme
LQLKGPVPILYVTNMDESIHFYSDVLGFRCANRTDGWAMLQCGLAEIMLSLPNEHLPFSKPEFTGSFYFQAEDVNSLWGNLRDRAAVVYAPENFDYGMREFAIRDNNGYILQFGQEIVAP